MRPTQLFLIIAASSLCLRSFAANSHSTAYQNRYGAIAERNIFGLTPMPPPHVPEQPSPPLPKIKLTGITTIFGNKRALLKVQFPPRPREPEKDQCYILAEGERDGPIEVLQVDEKLGQVKVDNSGTVMELTFEKSPASPAPTPAQTPRPNPAPRYPAWPHPSWQTAGR